MNTHLSSFTHKSIAVFGYGIEGKSIVQFLLAEHAKRIVIYEEKQVEQSVTEEVESFGSTVQFHSGPFPQEVDADVLFRSPGLRPDLPVFVTAKRSFKLVTSSTNVFLARCPCRVIGVTGTKGKGTTSALLTDMLRADGKDVYLGGNIGTPPLDFLAKLTNDSYVVLELSSFQLWDCDRSPHIGVIVMVTADHMDVHTDIQEYLFAKNHMLRHQQQNDFAVINWDHPNSQTISSEGFGIVYKTSLRETYHPGAYVSEGAFVYHDGHKSERIAETSELFIPGEHNIQNALSAIVAARLSGCSITAIQQGLKTFKGLPHRIELVGTIDGVSYYDDSFSTVPETAIAAIQAFYQPKIVILGGSSKQSDFHQLGNVISNSTSIRAIIGIGNEWERIKSKIKNPKSNIQTIEDCKNMEEIVGSAKQVAQPGDVVLLSPACASFDMFQNYKDRGNQFKEHVRNIMGTL